MCVLLLLQPRETETESVLSILACRVTLRNPIGLCVMRCSCCILIRPLNIWTVSLSRLATVARLTKNMEEFLPSEHSTRARAMFSCMTPSPSTSPFSSNSSSHLLCMWPQSRACSNRQLVFEWKPLPPLCLSPHFVSPIVFFICFPCFPHKKKDRDVSLALTAHGHSRQKKRTKRTLGKDNKFE